MKRFIITFICLITIVMSVDAQWYRTGGRAGNRMASYAHSVKINAMKNNAKLNYYSHNAKSSDMSWIRHFIILGGGIGGGNISLDGHSNGTFDLEFIAMNILFTAKFGNLFTIDPNKIDFKDADSFQLGVLIPIYTFDKAEYLWGQKGKFFVAPIIGFVSADDVNIDGHYYHSGNNAVEGHNCNYWISTSTTKNLSCTEFGGAVMVKYGCGYILGKVTNKSWGVTMGLCM